MKIFMDRFQCLGIECHFRFVENDLPEIFRGQVPAADINNHSATFVQIGKAKLENLTINPCGP
jgi:hypothetical protein